MSLGVGGYNDIGDAPFDPDKFDRKIRDGIDLLNAPLVEAWRRYLKLRSIGAAPNGTLHLKEGRVLVATNLDKWLDEYVEKGLPPAPSHAVEFGDRPNWPLPWHSDHDGHGAWTVYADNDWPICHCEDERSARAIVALGDTQALEDSKAVRADANSPNPLSEGRERS
jgi:hypothetical protein